MKKIWHVPFSRGWKSIQHSKPPVLGICAKLLCVSWNALSLLPPWGWHVLCGRSSWKCYTGLSFTWKCCKFILMHIFTEMPHKFCIYDLLGVIFISSVRSWLTCVGNRRYFFYIMLIFQLIVEVVTCEDSLKSLKGTWASMKCFLLEGFPAVIRAFRGTKGSWSLDAAGHNNITLKGFTSTWGSSLPSLGNPVTLPKLCWLPLGFGGQQGEVYRPKQAILRLWLTFQAVLQD